MPHTEDISLGSLKAGQSAIVTELRAEGALDLRLRELGFLPGTAVEMVRTAPLGDPIELRLRGFLIAVRRADLAKVWGRLSQASAK